MRTAVTTPHFALFALSCFLTFLLISTAAYLLCGLLARLATAAAARCALILAYLAGTSVLWLRTLAELATAAVQGTEASAALPGGPAKELWTLWVPADGMPLLTAAVPAGIALYGACLLGLAAAGFGRRRQLARAIGFRFLPHATAEALFGELAAEAEVPRSRLWLLPGHRYVPARGLSARGAARCGGPGAWGHPAPRVGAHPPPRSFLGALGPGSTRASFFPSLRSSRGAGASL